MIVEATVNGAQVSLMVDTGFSGYVLLREGIDVGKSSGDEELRDFVGKFRVSTVSLKSLRIGNHGVAVGDGAQIVQQPMRNMSISYNTHVDGILGLAALREQPFEINFQTQTLRFFPASASLAGQTPKSGVIASTLLPIGHSALQMSVELQSGQKLTMGLDTGNAFYATTHRDVLERVGLWRSESRPKFKKVSGVASGAVESWAARIHHVRIFGVLVDETVWDVIDLPSSAAEADGTVGFQFLRNFNLTIDFGSRIVWLENFNGKVSSDVQAEIGVVSAYSPTLRRMTVLDVAPESPAALAGLQEGDEPISVNGKDLTRENYTQMRHLLEGPSGTIVNLAVSRNGNLFRYKLKRELLVNELADQGKQ